MFPFVAKNRRRRRDEYRTIYRESQQGSCRKKFSTLIKNDVKVKSKCEKKLKLF